MKTQTTYQEKNYTLRLQEITGITTTQGYARLVELQMNPDLVERFPGEKERLEALLSSTERNIRRVVEGNYYPDNEHYIPHAI